MRTIEIFDQETETIILTKTVEDEKYADTFRRLKLQTELDNEGLEKPRYVAREKKESAGE